METNSVIAAIAKENQKLELICNQEIDYADSLRRRKSFFSSADELSNSCKRDEYLQKEGNQQSVLSFFKSKQSEFLNS